MAFSDDDSWWGPGALNRAAAILDANPRLALVGARVLVGPGWSIDPVSAQMAASGLARRGGPGPSVLGFVACGAIVRRSAFLAVGGFSIHYGIGGEEELLAIDLRAAGWHLAYCDDVVAHHCPLAGRDPQPRRRHQARNALWTTWLRRPVPVAVRHTAGVLAAAPRDRTARGGLGDAAARWRWALTNRCPVPRSVEADLRLLAANGWGAGRERPNEMKYRSDRPETFSAGPEVGPTAHA